MTQFGYDPELLPCADYDDSGRMVIHCGAFESFMKNEFLAHTSASSDPVEMEQEANLFTEMRLAEFVESGLCAYMKRCQEEQRVTIQPIRPDQYAYGQCEPLRVHAAASQN